MVHGEAAELPFSVLDDAIGSFSAEGNRIKVVLRASRWTGQEGILGETMAKLPLVLVKAVKARLSGGMKEES